MNENNEMFKEYPDILSVDDVMKMLGIGRNTAYEMVKNGTIKSIKLKKRYIIPKQAVLDLFRTAKE